MERSGAEEHEFVIVNNTYMSVCRRSRIQGREGTEVGGQGMEGEEGYARIQTRSTFLIKYSIRTYYLNRHMKRQA